MQEATAGYEQEPKLARTLAAAVSSMPAPAAGPTAAQALHTGFTSLCEHHLLPFQGVLRIKLIPAVAGTWPAIQAAVHQLVSCYSRRLQIQERLTHQVADALVPLAHQGAVLVLCDAVHMCMVARGVEQHSSATLTYAARGLYEADAAARSDALQQLLAPAQLA